MPSSVAAPAVRRRAAAPSRPPAKQSAALRSAQPLTICGRSPGFGAAARAAAQQVVAAALVAAHRRGRLAAEPSAVDITVTLVSARTSQRLHQRHFADPTPTDVMTFPDGSVDPVSGLLHLGDLAVCQAVAAAAAARRRRPPAEELVLYILHGALHLLGYDDRRARDQQRMWTVQRRLLATVGMPLEAVPTAAAPLERDHSKRKR